MPEDPRQRLLTLINRLASAPRADRPSLLLEILPLLGDVQLPVPFRVAATARVLRFVPDRPRPVRRVAHALTTGLSPSRRLERLRQLQHHVEKCDSLDDYIEYRESHVKLACPRCRLRLPRAEMIKHLWHEHSLTLDQGKARATSRVVEELQDRHGTTGDPEPLDHVATLIGTSGLRQWLAKDDPPLEEIAPLLQSAAAHGAGLCPGCYAELSPAVAPLPVPLELIHGRLSGEGYAIGVGGNAWFHTIRTSTPEKPTTVEARSLAPRAAATLAAAAILTLVLLVARSVSFAMVGAAIAAIVYSVIRFLRSETESPEVRAVNAAWTRLAPQLAKRANSVRFLTRLCLTSLGRGDPEVRVDVLNTIVERAAGRAEQSDDELQLLAAARVLQTEDLARYGRDVAAGIADLAAEGFAGRQSTDYAEYIASCYLIRPREAGDLARLRVLLIGAAFEAGLVPRDLLDAWAGASNLQQAMGVDPAHRLGLMFGLWRKRITRGWESIGPADTVFELARTSPPTAARVLARFPDLLLYHHLEPAAESVIGPVLICCRGVVVAGFVTADPDAEVQLSDDAKELNFGRHRIGLTQRLPTDVPGILKKWLQLRADSFLPFIDGYLTPGKSDVSKRVMIPLSRRCLNCGTVSAVTTGAIGRAVSVSDS